MDISVTADGTLTWADRRVPCALGRSGVTACKREGDGATPEGTFALREVLYRADRLPKPQTGLTVNALSADAGWCDDVNDPRYNRFIRLPCTARHERLWREDHLYDVVVVLGYNDDPVVAGNGSAIFLHVAGPDFPPTEGCVAIALDDLVELLGSARIGDRIVIQP